MQYDSGFDLLIAVFFSMIPQLEGLGPKTQYFVPFRLGEGEPLPYFHLKSLSIRNKLVFMIAQTG